MKKVTLIFLTILPLLSFSQVITNSTFNTDISGWKGQIGNTNDDTIIAWSSTEGSTAIGSMAITVPDATTNYRAQSDPNALLTQSGDYILSFMVKGIVGTTIQGAIFQGGLIAGDNYNISTTGWEAYSTLISGLDNITNTNVRIVAKNSSGSTVTYYIDEVKLTRLVTENNFISNSDFETGDLTDWTLNGPDVEASVITDMGTNGTNVAQITFTQAATTVNNYLESAVYDFGATVNPSTINFTFDANANNEDLTFQVVVRTFDASDVLVESVFSGKQTVGAGNANQWVSIQLSRAISMPFNKIAIRIRVPDNGAMGDKAVIDNVSGEFSYILGVNDKVVQKNNDFKLFPNPAQNIINIKNLSGISQVSIYDITGKQVLGTTKINNDKLNVSSLKTGLYVVKVEDNNGSSSVKKLVISR